MSQMTSAQARAIDPVLTEVARGYRSNSSPVANILFPVVNVGQRGGRIIQFSPDGFKLYNTARAPGANTRRIQFGYASTPYALVDYRLEGSVPVELMEEAMAVPGIDLAAGAVRAVQDLQALETEKQAADLARNAAFYASSNKVVLSGSSQWTDSSSDPLSLISDAKETVRQQIGVRPNVLTVAPKALQALRRHPKILDKISTSTDRTPATLLQLAAFFELEQVVEAGAIYHDGTQFQDVWGKDALLAYTRPASLAEMGSPNYGYTYQLTGRPAVEEAYFDRNTNTWYYPVNDARAPVLAGAAAGFFIQNAVA